jgi:hypothetical protein
MTSGGTDRDRNSSLALAVLAITAVVLLAAILVVLSGPPRAMAIGQLDRGGDYIMVTGQFTENSEVVYVTDAAAKRMIMYSYEATTRAFQLWDGFDLQKLPK